MALGGFQRFIGLLTSAVVVLSPMTAAQGEWKPSYISDSDLSKAYYFSVADTTFGPKLSYLMASTPSAEFGRAVDFCKELTGPCDPDLITSAQLGASLLWSACESSEQVDCLETASIQGEEAKLRTLPGESVAADPNYQLHSGAGPIEVTLSDGSQFLIVSSAKYNLRRSAKRFEPMSLETQVIPVQVVNGNYATTFVPANNGRESFTGGQPGCIWNTLTTCWKEMGSLQTGTAIQLTMRLSKLWGGFFKGRLLEPNLTAETQAGFQRVKISGTPMPTHKIFFKIDPANLTENQKSALCAFSDWCQLPQPGQTGLVTRSAGSIGTAKLLDAFGAEHADTAADIVNEWSFGFSSESKARCLVVDSGITGMVTSNAPIYQSGPPTFNFGYLSYEVAGLHYEPDGKSLNLGTYDLILRSDAARCLYGFSSAPVSATVQVLNDSGKQVTAVTTVGEADGWLSLRAKGFTFSEKEVRVRISQPLKAVISRFSGNTSALSARQKNEVKAVVRKRLGTELVTCSVGYQKSTERALAIKRAKSICDYVKTSNRGLRTKATVVSVKSSKLIGSITLSSKG